MHLPGRGEWLEGRKDAEFHLDPSKQDIGDPRREAELQGVLDQIGSATVEQLMIIQKNIADAIGANADLLNDPATVRKVEAVYKRSQELGGVESSDTRTLH